MSGGGVRLSSFTRAAAEGRRRADAARSSDSDGADDLSASRGVLICALLGMGLWVATLYLIRFIAR
jgi:hypothetical protein